MVASSKLSMVVVDRQHPKENAYRLNEGLQKGQRAPTMGINFVLTGAVYSGNEVEEVWVRITDNPA